MAAGLHQPLGLVVVDGLVCVLGRDQITRLHDLNANGEADFYECVTNAYETSPGGHDFVTGLEAGPDGLWYFVSATQGVCRVAADGKSVDSLATGFRNANGLTAEGHLSTARDMNKLGRHLFYDFPQYYHIFSRRTADAGIATVSNVPVAKATR